MAMHSRTHLAKRLTGVGRMLAVIMLALVVESGIAQAQSAPTTSSHASLSGIQSVITQTRDSLQRQARAVKLRLQHKQTPPANADAPDPNTK